MCLQSNTELGAVRRRRFVKIMKPLLPRKRSSSARINLNRHWNELEELYGETYRTRVTHFERLLLHTELNDNALNEAREAAAAAAAVASSAAAVIQEEEDMLTPPPTPPSLGTTSSFNFTGTIVSLPLLSDAIDDSMPMTPTATPLAWDVFTFPISPFPEGGDTNSSPLR